MELSPPATAMPSLEMDTLSLSAMIPTVLLEYKQGFLYQCHRDSKENIMYYGFC